MAEKVELKVLKGNIRKTFDVFWGHILRHRNAINNNHKVLLQLQKEHKNAIQQLQNEIKSIKNEIRIIKAKNAQLESDLYSHRRRGR